MSAGPRLTLADAVRALGARKAGANDYRAACPAHGGDNPDGLSLAEGGGGELLVTCHTHGCDGGAVLAAVRAKLGVPAAASSPSSRGPRLGVPVREYVYRDAAGAAVGVVKRFEPPGEGKTFRQYHADGTTPGAPAALRTTPYNLTAVREAIAAGRAVFVVEGEKDVETLATLQHTATCNAMGAGKWTTAHAAHLAGAKSVVVLPDHDEAGRQHADAVARTLVALDPPPRVRVVALPGLEPKGDVTDWVCAGGTPAQLVEIVRAAPLYQASDCVASGGAGDRRDLVAPNRMPPEADEHPTQALADADGVPAYPQAVRLLDAEDEPPPTWLVPDLIPRSEPVLIVGPDGSMKSTVALHLACAVAAGGRVFEHGAAIDPAPVIVVSGEDPRGVIANRCTAIAKGHGWPRERVLGNLHVLALAGTDLALAGWRAHLVAEVTRTGAALVILDPLADLASGEENDNTERRAVVATWRALAAAGATPVLIHHAGKAGSEGRSKRERIRGASAIAAASRCTYFVEAGPAGVVAECLKMSRAERPAPFAVAADITADAKNRAVWTSARLTRTTQRRAEMTAAEQWVLRYVGECPGVTSAQLREAVKGVGLSRFALSDAMNEETGLGARGLLRYEPGPRGARFWHLTDDGAAALDPTGRVEDFDPTDPTCTLPGRVDGDRFDPTHPLEGGRVDRAGTHCAGRVDADAAYLTDERTALDRQKIVEAAA